MQEHKEHGSHSAHHVTTKEKKELIQQYLRGNFQENVYQAIKQMIPKSKLMIFVSSTFTDSQKERNLLHEKILPSLQNYTMSSGLQIILYDMRFGVKDENTVNQMTWILCKEAIQQCYEESGGLFFLSLQGNKYGYTPLPKYIDQDVFDEFIKQKFGLPHAASTQQLPAAAASILSPRSTTENKPKVMTFSASSHSDNHHSNHHPPRSAAQRHHHPNNNHHNHNNHTSSTPSLSAVSCDTSLSGTGRKQSTVDKYSSVYDWYLLDENHLPIPRYELKSLRKVDDKEFFEKTLPLLRDEILDSFAFHHFPKNDEHLLINRSITEWETLFAFSLNNQQCYWMRRKFQLEQMKVNHKVNTNNPHFYRYFELCDVYDNPSKAMKLQILLSKMESNLLPHPAAATNNSSDGGSNNHQQHRFSIVGTKPLIYEYEKEINPDSYLHHKITEDPEYAEYLIEWESHLKHVLMDEVELLMKRRQLWEAFLQSFASSSSGGGGHHGHDNPHHRSAGGADIPVTMMEELFHHCNTAYNKAKLFLGREELVSRALDFLHLNPSTTTTEQHVDGLAHRGTHFEVNEEADQIIMTTRFSAVALAIVGKSGAGKTALMSYLAHSIGQKEILKPFNLHSVGGVMMMNHSSSHHHHPNPNGIPVIIRYCGTSRYSLHAIDLIHSISLQLLIIYHDFARLASFLSHHMTQSYEEAVKTFHEILSHHPVYLFIDSIDQLFNTNEERSTLNFLSDIHLHRSSRIIISTLPDEYDRKNKTWKYLYYVESVINEHKIPKLSIETSTIRRSATFHFNPHDHLQAATDDLLHHEESSMKRSTMIVPAGSKEEQEIHSLVVGLLQRRNRKLTPSQLEIVYSAIYHEPTVLYINLAMEVISKWRSFDQPIDDSVNLSSSMNKKGGKPLSHAAASVGIHLEPTVKGVIHQIFDDLEKQFGTMFTANVFAFLTFSREGLNDLEIQDLLTLHHDVMREIFQYSSLETILLFPLHVWLRLKSVIKNLIIEKENACSKWYHRQLWETAQEKYASFANTVHRIMGKYFTNQYQENMAKNDGILIFEETNAQQQQQHHHSHSNPAAKKSKVLVGKPTGSTTPPPPTTPPPTTTQPAPTTTTTTTTTTTSTRTIEKRVIISSQPLILNQIPIWFPTSKVNQRRSMEGIYHLIHGNLIKEAIHEICNFENVCASALIGDGYNYVIFVSELLKKHAHHKDFLPHKQRIDHYIRWLRKEMTTITDNPRRKVITTASNEPTISIVRKDLLHYLTQFQSLPPLFRSDSGQHHNAKASTEVETMKNTISLASNSDDGTTTNTNMNHNSSMLNMTMMLSKMNAKGADYWVKEINCQWRHDFDPLLSNFIGHKESILSLAWNIDGSKLLSGSTDKMMKLWDIATGQVITTFKGHADAVYAVVWNPEIPMQAASGSGDHKIKIWDATTGQLIKTLEGSSQAIYTLAYSPDGTLLYSGSAEKTIKIWDIATSSIIRILEGHSNTIYSILFHPDGKTFASASVDKKILLWNAEMITSMPTTLNGHTKPILCLAWNKDGSILASGSVDTTICLWYTKTQLPHRTLTGHTAVVYSISFNERSSHLVSASVDKRLLIWDISTGMIIRTLFDSGSTDIYAVQWSKVNNQIASGFADSTIKIWDGTDALSEHNESIASPGQIYSIEWNHHPQQNQPSQQQQQLVSGSQDGVRRIWDMSTYSLSKFIRGHTEPVTAVAWYHPNDTEKDYPKRIFSASEDKTMKTWDPDDPAAATTTFKEHTSKITTLTTHSSLLISGAEDGTIKVHYTPNHHNSFLTSLESHRGAITSVTFSPEGNKFASASRDRSIIVWYTSSYQIVQELRGHTDAVNCLSWHPDSIHLASGSDDNTVRIWDTISNKVIGTCIAHLQPVLSVAFHPDGTKLASGGKDKTIRIWNTINFHILYNIKAHVGDVHGLTWNITGTQLTSCSTDGTIKVWEIMLLDLTNSVHPLMMTAGPGDLKGITTGMK